MDTYPGTGSRMDLFAPLPSVCYPIPRLFMCEVILFGIELGGVEIIDFPHPANERQRQQRRERTERDERREASK